jgi:hypothetical protein
MSTLNKLRFVPAPAAVAKDPAARKRQRFLTRIEEQLAVLDDPGASKPDRRYRRQPDGTRKLVRVDVRINSWVRPSGSGYVIVPRLNGKPVEFEAGHAGIGAAGLPEVRAALDLLAEATRAGELDRWLTPGDPSAHVDQPKAATKRRKAPA